MLVTLDDEIISVPLFNIASCPFCGHRARLAAPALFHAPSRNQVIYCLPVPGARTEQEAVATLRPVIEEIRRHYMARLDQAQRAAFERTTEILTHDVPSFLAAIQLGHDTQEWHAWLHVRLADGSGVLSDPTKAILIDLLPEELEEHWADADAADVDTGPALERGIAAFRAGKLDEARRELEAFVGSHPEDPIGRHNLATVYIKLGEIERARKLLGSRGS